MHCRWQGGALQTLAEGIEGLQRQGRQSLAHQGQVALIVQPLRQIGETLYSQGLPAIGTGRRQIMAQGIVIGGRCLLQLIGQLGMQTGHLGLGRTEGIGIVGQPLGLLLVQLASQLVAQGFHYLIHEVLGAA